MNNVLCVIALVIACVLGVISVTLDVMMPGLASLLICWLVSRSTHRRQKHLESS